MSNTQTYIDYGGERLHCSWRPEGAKVRDDRGSVWEAHYPGGWALVRRGKNDATTENPDLRDPVAGNPKHAAGLSKPPLHLVPMTAVIQEALVFKLGAAKYGPFNWRDHAVVRSIYLDAAMRHLMALMDGQDLDEESGRPHEAHIRACMAILLDARPLGKLIDDRNTAGPTPDTLRQNITTALKNWPAGPVVMVAGGGR